MVIQYLQTQLTRIPKRSGAIFILTHFYPVFIAGHLYFGDWCRRCQVMFNAAPIIVFGGLILVWKETSHLSLNKIEKFNLFYFISNLVFIYCYYMICIFADSKWVYDKNWQVAAFILITLLLYGHRYFKQKFT